MDIATITQIVGGFQKLIGETLADLKRAEFATIDIDLLRLKRTTLRERLEDLEKELAAAAELAKGNKAGELADRGLGGSTIMDSFTMAIERDSNDQLAVARREYNRAIEEIALMERRIVESRVSCWKRARRWFRRS